MRAYMDKVKWTAEVVLEIAKNIGAPEELANLLVKRWFYPPAGIGIQLPDAPNRDRAVIEVNRGIGSLWAE